MFVTVSMDIPDSLHRSLLVFHGRSQRIAKSSSGPWSTSVNLYGKHLCNVRNNIHIEDFSWIEIMGFLQTFENYCIYFKHLDNLDKLLTIQTYPICPIWCATFKDLGNIIYPLKVIGLSLMFVELSILRCSHGASDKMICVFRAWTLYAYLTFNFFVLCNWLL